MNLISETSFNLEELKELYRKFLIVTNYKLYMNQDEFILFQEILGLQIEEWLIEKIFNLINKKINEDNFGDFVKYLDILINGDYKKRAEFLFKIIDQDKKGFFDLNDLKSLFYLVSKHDLKEKFTYFQKEVFIISETLYEILDKNNTGKIDLKTFQLRIKEDNYLLEIFGHLGNGVKDLIKFSDDKFNIIMNELILIMDDLKQFQNHLNVEYFDFNNDNSVNNLLNNSKRKILSINEVIKGKILGVSKFKKNIKNITKRKMDTIRELNINNENNLKSNFIKEKLQNKVSINEKISKNSIKNKYISNEKETKIFINNLNNNNIYQIYNNNLKEFNNATLNPINIDNKLDIDEIKIKNNINININKINLNDESVNSIYDLENSLESLKKKNTRSISNKNKTSLSNLDKKYEVNEFEIKNIKFKIIQKLLDFEENINEVCLKIQNELDVKDHFYNKINILKTKNKNNQKFLSNKKLQVYDENWGTMIAIMNGIWKSINSIHEGQKKLSNLDFKSKNIFKIVHPGIENAIDCEFIDYCPEVFMKIRKMYGITNSLILNSLGPNSIKSIFEVNLNTMIKISSSGKSGSFFYYSNDYKFLVKTIFHKEKTFMLKILRNYLDYLTGNPKSYINKIIGLYKLKITYKNNKKKTYYLTISQNIFERKPDIIYDLKGSTYKRETLNTTTNDVPLKDLNFLHNKEKIYIENNQANQFLKNVKKDVTFLKSNNINDYSWLLGIENNSKKADIRNFEQEFDDNKISYKIYESVFGKHKNKLNKSYISPDKKLIYHIGIIDILTNYNYKKSCEYLAKSLVYGNSISCLPPDKYAERFINFIQKSLFSIKNI